MYRAWGPWSAVSRVCRPGPSTSSSAASTRTTSRWSGTTIRAPRPASTAARAASASSHGQSRPGTVAGSRQQGCRRRPTRSDVRQERGPGRIGRPGPGVPRVAGGPCSGGSTARAFSAVACRGGTASRRTSPSVPAYRVATSRAVASTSGASTGSGETTRRSGLSRPGCSAMARRSRTNPSRSWPANRTLTRTPATAAGAMEEGTEYSKGRSRWASPVSTCTSATGRSSVVGSSPASRRGRAAARAVRRASCWPSASAPWPSASTAPATPPPRPPPWLRN